MTPEEFSSYQEKRFIAYFKQVIKNEARDAHAELDRLAEQETSLVTLPSKAEIGLITEDSYDLELSLLSGKTKLLSKVLFWDRHFCPFHRNIVK